MNALSNVFRFCKRNPQVALESNDQKMQKNRFWAKFDQKQSKNINYEIFFGHWTQWTVTVHEFSIGVKILTENFKCNLSILKWPIIISNES